MARLRLFANLREAAGASEVEVEGATVGEIVEWASQRYGDDFRRGVVRARYWVNGEPAEAATAVASNDEVALIPPVSGGAVALSGSDPLRLFIPAALVGALVAATFASVRSFIVVFVAVAAVWAWDLAGQAAQRGAAINLWPVLLSTPAPAWGAYRWGFAGFSFGVAIALGVTLLWPILRDEHRSVPDIAATATASLAVAAGAGSLVLLRAGGSELVGAYLIVAGVALLAERVIRATATPTPIMEPALALLLGAVAAGAVTGVGWGPSWRGMFVAAVVAAPGIVAGNALGSLLRSGAIQPRPSGFLALLDGPMLAAGLYWAALALFG